MLEALQKKFGATQGEKVWEDFRSQNDPEAPTTVHNKRFPYETDAQEPQGRGAARPGHGPVRQRRQRQDRPARARRRRRARASLPDVGDLLAPLRQHTVSPTRCWSRAASPRAAHPAGGLRSAGLLLHAADPDGGGAPRPGVRSARPASTPAERRSREPTSTSSSATAATTHGARPRRARTSSTPTPSSSATRVAGKPTLASTGYVFDGQCTPFDVLTRNISWTPNLGDPTPAGSETLTSYRSKLGIVDRAGDDSRQALRLHPPARHLRPRGRPVHDRVLGLRRGQAHADARRLHAFGVEHLADLQLALHQPQAHRLLQLGPEPAAAEERRPQPPGARQAAVPLEGLRPQPAAVRAAQPASSAHPQPPQHRRPALHHQLEQQAGSGLQRRRRPVRVRAAVPKPGARRQHPPGHQGAQEGEPCRPDLGDGGRRDRRRPRALRPPLHLQGHRQPRNAPGAERRSTR